MSIRPNNLLNQRNHKKKKTNNSKRASPRNLSLHHHSRLLGMVGVLLALHGGLAAVAVTTTGTEGASPVVASLDGLVAAIPLGIIRVPAGLIAELMASQCRARRPTL